MLVQKYSGQIIINNVENGSEMQLMHSFQNLKGYRIEKDSILLYTEREGQISVYKLYHGITDSNTTHKPIIRSNLTGKYNGIQTYEWSGFNLKILDGGTVLKLFKGDSLIWHKIHDQSSSVFSLKQGYQSPLFSFKDYTILFQENYLHFFIPNRPKVVEFSMITGKEKVICKQCFDPSLSKSGRYILFKKSDCDNVYESIFFIDKINNKIKEVENSQAAFWIK